MSNFANNLRAAMGMMGSYHPSRGDSGRKDKSSVWADINDRDRREEGQWFARPYGLTRGLWENYDDRYSSSPNKSNEMGIRGGLSALGSIPASIIDTLALPFYGIRQGARNIADTANIAMAPKRFYAPNTDFFDESEIADVKNLNDIDTTRDFYVVNNYGQRDGGKFRIGYKDGKIATIYFPEGDAHDPIYGDPIYGRKNIAKFFRDTFDRDDYENVFVSAGKPGVHVRGTDTDDTTQYPVGRHYWGEDEPFNPVEAFYLKNDFGGKEYGL